jgi:Tol biopolymer transport system component
MRNAIFPAALLLAACHAPDAPVAPAGPAAPPAPASPYALPEPAPDPVLFAPGVISTGEFESSPSFTPDGQMVYFVRSEPRRGRWTIFQSHFEAGRWTQPGIAPFSGQFRDSDPYVTADGRQFFFISDRPVDGLAKADMDIWIMERTPQGWSEPHNPGAPLNSAQSEWHPTMTKRGTLYFGSSRPGGYGLTDLYRATSGGGEWHVENLGAPVNTTGYEYEPLIAADESVLIFMAYRPDAHGSSDLYISRSAGNSWTAPVNLGPSVNSTELEFGANFSPDGKYLFFTSTRKFVSAATALTPPGNGNGDIYQVDLATALGPASAGPPTR